MGAKLGKSKTLTLSGKEAMSNSTPQLDGTTTLETKNKKKRGKISSQKSLDLKVDKFTSTDGNAASSSSAYIQQLVNGLASNHFSSDEQMRASNQSNTPSKDVLELRDACIRRGIISAEISIDTLPVSTEADQQENIIQENTITTTEVPTNNDEQ